MHHLSVVLILISLADKEGEMYNQNGGMIVSSIVKAPIKIS
jgi:hypothetical protein